MISNRLLILFLIILSFNIALSQEVVSHLTVADRPFSNDYNNLSKSVNTVPFIDDFSIKSMVLDSNLWKNSSVFINRSYALNPPTIGVATFDGLNSQGLAYNLSANSYGDADTLLSKEIDLSNLSAAYLMFYYQPQGLGDNPQQEDSLILEFKDINSNWHVIWKKPGNYNHEFKKEVFIINSIDYLISNFQFRFRNKASLSGNFDHWHVDYVILDEFTASSDTSELNDVSFVYDCPSVLKRYNEMPWYHFLNNESNELKDSLQILLRNNHASINVDYNCTIYKDQTVVYSSQKNLDVYDYNIIGNLDFQINVNDNSFSVADTVVTFDIQHVINTHTSDYKKNDTLYRSQTFSNYFSYDDGSAELAYGINSVGAKGAYQFKLNRPDTLRAIKMYFPQMLDSVNNIEFILTVWNDNGGYPGDTLYTQRVYPVHSENRDFHVYTIERPFRIIGTFYVGWEQITSDLLNIGLDKNLLANQYMFYNVGSGWLNSQFPGSWMVRPVFSQSPLPSMLYDSKITCSIFPNPVSSDLFIKLEHSSCELRIFNLQGLLVKKMYLNNLNNIISVADLYPGVYIIHLKNEYGQLYQKLIVKNNE